MNQDNLWSEFTAARRAMTGATRAQLRAYGVAAGDIILLVGVTRARIAKGGLYEPAEDGCPHYITPILVDTPVTPESPNPELAVRFGDLIDVLAWRPAEPSSWALRTGTAESLGAVPPQYLHPDPVPIWRKPLAWLRAGCTGLVPLSREPADLYRLLTLCRRIEAEDAAHAAELRGIIERPWPGPRLTAARAAPRPPMAAE